MLIANEECETVGLFPATTCLLLSLSTSLYDDVEARWREEYPKAVKELEEILRSFSAEGRLTRHFVTGDEFIVGELGVAVSGDRRVVSRDQKTRRPKVADLDLNANVVCATPEYTFELKRTSPDGPYLILRYDPRRPEDDTDVEIEFNVTVRCMTQFSGHTLLERMESPTFVLKSAELVAEEGTELVRLDYEWEGELQTESGSVFLEPARKWAIRRTDITTIANPASSSIGSEGAPRTPDPPIRRRVEVSYQDLPGGIPFPARTSVLVQTPDPSRFQEDRCEIDQVTLGEPNPELFRLTGYGLPDLPLTPRSQPSAFSLVSPWFLVSFTIALASFVGLWVLRRRAAV